MDRLLFVKKYRLPYQVLVSSGSFNSNLSPLKEHCNHSLDTGFKKNKCMITITQHKLRFKVDIFRYYRSSSLRH